MSRIRALAKESLVYGISSLASRFLNFLLVPFYTHVMAPGDFGVMNLVLIVIAFMNVITQAGFDAAYLRLGADAEGDARKRLFASAFLGQAAIAALLTAALALLAGPVGSLMAVPEGDLGLFRYAAAILLVDTLCVVPMAHLRLTHKALLFASIRMANVLVNIGANLILVLWLRQGLAGVFQAYLAASLSTLLLCLPVLSANVRAAMDRAALRELLRFGLPLIPAGLWFILIEMAGRLVISRLGQDDIERLYPGRGYDTLALLGIFSAALKLGVFGMLLVQMYRMAWTPFFLKHQKDADGPQLFSRILLLLLVGVGYASVTVMAALDWLVAIPVAGRPVIHEAYWAGLAIVPGVLLAYACEAWSVHFQLGIYIAKDTRYLIFTNAVGALVAVGGNLLLVPVLGLWGAAVSACACYLAIATLVTRRSQRHYPIPIPVGRLAPILLWMAAGWALGIAVQAAPDRFPPALRLGALAGFYALPPLLGFFPLAALRGLRPRRPAA